MCGKIKAVHRLQSSRVSWPLLRDSCSVGGSRGVDENYPFQWSFVHVDTAALPPWLLLGVFSWGLGALYLLRRTACLLEATFASQKLEKEGVNMASLVRELSHSMVGEVSITLFCKLSCFPSDNKTTICWINRNSGDRGFLATSLSEVLCLLAGGELEEAFKL